MSWHIRCCLRRSVVLFLLSLRLSLHNWTPPAAPERPRLKQNETHWMQRRRPLVLLLSALAVLGGCQKKSSPEPARDAVLPPASSASAQAAQGAIDPDQPATCAPCHGAVVEEFRESLHSRAHHANDPLYGALRALRIEKQGPHIPGACANCHNPRDTVDHESLAAKAGVTCATCHQIEGVHTGEGRKGIQALQVGPPRRFRGVHDLPEGASPVHGTGPAVPAIQDGVTLCLSCHGEEKNAAGVVTCSTGTEFAEARGSSTCVGCHMKETPGPSGAVVTRSSHRSHLFAGPHLQHRSTGPGMIEEALAISGRIEGEKLIARLENRSGHSFPTGFPGRMALLEIRALDASGKELARNISSDPMKDHPEAVFNRGYVDADNKPVLAPFAARMVRDNRLKPAETREILFAIPPGTVHAELRLKFFLIAPPAARMLGYQGPETRPIILPPVRISR
jgi:hypothetical protein